MFAGSEGRKSVDSLSSTSGLTHKADFPFHRVHPSGSLARQRRESFASSIHSVGGTLDTASGGWADSVLETGQNAISTLLQPPIVRTGLLPHTSAPAHSTHKAPTAKDIPPVTLTNITHVDSSEFASYLSQVGALHEQLRRVKESEGDQAAGAPPRRNSSRDDLGEVLKDGYLRPGSSAGVGSNSAGSKRGSSARRLSVSSVSSFNLNETSSPSRRASANTGGRKGGGGGGGGSHHQGPPPLSTIPNVYFEEDFHLENPRTFDIVSERSEVVPSSTTTTSTSASSGNNSIASAPPAAPRKALATNAILQEKLSWYMDTVEMHLITSISTASTAFFTALGSLKELHTEAADSVGRIKALRSELGELDREMALQGLEIVQKQRRRQNVQQFHAAVMQLADVVDGLGACEALVDAGEVEKALDSIDALERLMAGQSAAKKTMKRTKTKKTKPLKYKPRDLRGAAALQGIGDDMATLRFRIGKAYEARFVAVLMADIRRHTETVATQEVLMRWNSASLRARGGHSREPSAFPAYLASTDSLRAELLPLLTGLQRANHIVAATQAFRELLMREIRNLVRKPLPSSNDDDNESVMSTSTMSTGRGGGGGRTRTQQEKSSILARNLRSLDANDSEELLIHIYTSVTETLRRLTTQAKVLLDVASSVGEEDENKDAEADEDEDEDGEDDDEDGEGDDDEEVDRDRRRERGAAAAALKSPPVSPSGRPMQPPLSSAGLEAQGQLHRTLDVNNLLGQAVDMAQDKIVRLLRVRSEQSARLSMTPFLRYFTLNLHFALECEAISGRSGTSLKMLVNTHIKEFVQRYGDAEIQKLAQGMEQDQWTAKDFDEQDTALLQKVLNASTEDAADWAEGVKLWVPATEGDMATGEGARKGEEEHNGASATVPGGKIKTHGAVVDAQSFQVPNSAVLCLGGVTRFMHLTVAIPFMTSDIAAVLVQYLQLFNSRCTQLILGAGATRSAGLKNITTKHLAIASQALAFLAALVPYVREFMRRRLKSLPGGGGAGGDGGGSSNGGNGGSSNSGGSGSMPMMAEFDKVKRSFQEHQNSIYDKLVEMMSRRAQSHAKVIQKHDWEAGADAAPAVLPYIDTLVKETLTLSRNLSKTVTEDTARFVMASVFAEYKKELGAAFRAAEISTTSGRDRLLRDIDSYTARLSKIDGFGDSGDFLRKIAMAKAIRASAPAPPPKPPAPASSAPPAPPASSPSPPLVAAAEPAVMAQKAAQEVLETAKEESSTTGKEEAPVEESATKKDVPTPENASLAEKAASAEASKPDDSASTVTPPAPPPKEDVAAVAPSSTSAPFKKGGRKSRSSSNANNGNGKKGPETDAKKRNGGS